MTSKQTNTKLDEATETLEDVLGTLSTLSVEGALTKDAQAWLSSAQDDIRCALDNIERSTRNNNRGSHS